MPTAPGRKWYTPWMRVFRAQDNEWWLVEYADDHFDGRRANKQPTKAYAYYRRVVQRDPCSYCPGPGGTKDHIVASAADGPDVARNLTGACERCNMAKGKLSLLGFLLGGAVP